MLAGTGWTLTMALRSRTWAFPHITVATLRRVGLGTSWAVRGGFVPQGSYLLVENLDRISRQTLRKALRALEDIVDAGVIVVTLSDGRQYTVESLDDPTALMMAVLTFARANEESTTKARRLRSAWEHKRERAGEKALTARGPAWLWLNDARQFEVIEERAEIVRRIYSLTLAGWGQHRIAVTLNQEGVRTFGRSKMEPVLRQEGA